MKKNKYKKVVLCIEAFEVQNYQGFINPSENWNGFEIPSFEPKVMERIYNDWNNGLDQEDQIYKMTYNEKLDQYELWFDEFKEILVQIKKETIVHDGQVIEVYKWEDGYCWDAYDSKEDEVLVRKIKEVEICKKTRLTNKIKKFWESDNFDFEYDKKEDVLYCIDEIGEPKEDWSKTSFKNEVKDIVENLKENLPFEDDTKEYDGWKSILDSIK